MKLAVIALIVSSCGAASVSTYGAVNAACIAEQASIVESATPANGPQSEADFAATVRVCKRIKARVREACGDDCR